MLSFPKGRAALQSRATGLGDLLFRHPIWRTVSLFVFPSVAFEMPSSSDTGTVRANVKSPTARLMGVRTPS